MSKKKLVVGVDEAGYGPSMGPLTICATAWRVPFDLNASETTSLLEPEFLAKPIKQNSTHVPIGDSKKIHRDTYAVEGLILGARFLSFAIDGKVPIEWDSQIARFASEDWNRLSAIPWYAKQLCGYSNALDSIIPDQADYFQAAMKKIKSHGIQLVGIRMRVLDEIEFNRQVDRTGNKSTLLSEASLGLVKQVILELGKKGENVEVYCDKHGGRNRYQAILTYSFDEEWFDIEIESRDCSRYQSKWAEHAMQIQFKVEGDSIFPSAAASIIAKWTREDLMNRLNGFWKCKVVGGVKPTAGYYVDAMRFAKQIDVAVKKLGLATDQWWRKK
jgi:ribonuclease HII